MPASRTTGIVIHPSDNVATVLSPVEPGSRIVVKGGPDRLAVDAADGIPAGHKVCLHPIRKGERVVKYGEAIGLATADIEPGRHVHVHNVDSQRGRGDRPGGGRG